MEDIEKSCHDCQQVQFHPPLAPLHPWKWPTRPWARLHLVHFKAETSLSQLKLIQNGLKLFALHPCLHRVSLRNSDHLLPSLPGIVPPG